MGNGIATEGAMVVLEYAKEKGIEEVFSLTEGIWPLEK